MFSSYGPLLKALRSFFHPVSTEAAMRWYFHAHVETDMPHGRSSFAGLASLELYSYPLRTDDVLLSGVIEISLVAWETEQRHTMGILVGILLHILLAACDPPRTIFASALVKFVDFYQAVGRIRRKPSTITYCISFLR